MADRAQSRREREEKIRTHSEQYGLSWCAANASTVVAALRGWRSAEPAPDLKLRVYNREENRMEERSIVDVFSMVHLDEKGCPMRLAPTAFGQVVLAPTMHVSTVVYHMLCAVWNVA